MISKFFLQPRAVAIIGASKEPTKIGYQILKNIIAAKFPGRIYPINLHGGLILGLKANLSLADLKYKNKKELLIIMAIPADFVLDELLKAGKLGFKNFVIISAGFKESGPAGKVREEKLKAIAQKYKLNILGPNCLGFINNLAHLNLSFASSRPLSAGRHSGLAFLSQSGALGSAVLDWFDEQKINFELFISLGNKTVCSENDFLEILLKEKRVKAIFLYLEEISQGERFLNLVSRLAKQKPVFVLKAGTTSLGGQAAKSHTGSLAGSNEVVMLALKRAGAIILNSLEESFDLLEFFRPLNWQSRQPADLIIVSNAGGPAVLSADEVEELGLNLAPLSPALAQVLKKKIPVLVNLNNPLDLLGDADPKRYELALDIILRQATNTQILVLLTAQTMTDPLAIAKIIVRLAKKYPAKNIFTSFIGGTALEKANKYLRAQQIAAFSAPEAALVSWQKLFNYLKTRSALKIYSTPKSFKSFLSARHRLNTDSLVGFYDYLKSLALLKKYKIPTVMTTRYFNALPLSFKFPLALKVVGPDFIHKSDRQAVVLNLTSLTGLKRAAITLKKRYAKFLKNPLNYLIVQEMETKRQEIILGFKRDLSFGPVLMVGQGGIYTEVFKDIKLSLADLNFKSALSLIKELKIDPILEGTRGQKMLDVKALARAWVNLARLAKEHPEIKELDINPLFVKTKGVAAADVRIII